MASDDDQQVIARLHALGPLPRRLSLRSTETGLAHWVSLLYDDITAWRAERHNWTAIVLHLQNAAIPIRNDGLTETKLRVAYHEEKRRREKRKQKTVVNNAKQNNVRREERNEQQAGVLCAPRKESVAEELVRLSKERST